MISVKMSGSFKRSESFFKRIFSQDIYAKLENFARQGVIALQSGTPVDSGETAASWDYEVSHHGGTYTISWLNYHLVDGVPIAIILQYGHGTGTGGYVQGRDYINPAMWPVFDKIANDVWDEVTSA